MSGSAVSWKACLMATNGGASWFRRLFSGSKKNALDPTRTDLVIVASSFDDAESCSTALERGAGRSGWVASDDVVFRHHLILPAEFVDDAVSIVAQDGYELVRSPVPEPRVPSGGGTPSVANGRPVTFQRVQVIDTLHCSQERSRMAGLAQRRDGYVVGWDALQPSGPIAD